MRSVLVNAGLVLVVFVAVMAYQGRNLLPAGGEAAPELRGMTLSGDGYDLEAMKGRPALVYFFAPWCKICGASAGNLARLRRWLDPEALEIVAVALDWENVDEVRAYAQRHELGVPVLLGRHSVQREWQVYAFPTYYVLDSEHRVTRRDVGYSSQFGLWWRSWSAR